MNTLIITGRLTREPEHRVSGGGVSIVKFSIAWEDVYLKKKNDANSTSFFDVVLFGKSCEAFCKYIHKGDAVIILGRIGQDRWEDKETGQKRSKVVITAQSWEFPPQNKRRDEPKQESQKAIDYTATGGHVAVEDSDIPF